MTSANASPTTLLGLTDAVPGTNTAIIVPEQDLKISYAALRENVTALAQSLSAAGVQRGDRIGMAMPNGLACVVSFLASAMAGTSAPLNPGYKDDEFQFYLDDTNARVLLLPPDGLEEARSAAKAKNVRVLIVDTDATGKVTLQGATDRKIIPAPPIDDVALILHTSGSTGRPKRVPLSHRNLTISARNVARSYALTDRDVSLCVMPLFHVHGLVASTLATLSTGGTVVVPAKFNPMNFWQIAEAHGATWYSAVPTIHQLLLARVKKDAPKPAGAGKLRFIRSCSASLPPQVLHDLEAAFGAPVLEAYGMSEAAHQMSSNPLPVNGPHLPGSVGRGTDVEIAIADDQGNFLKPGERGEVCIKGPNVITAYENNPEANATSFFNGWFRTGDQGFLDDNGYLTLVGRLKELINRGGEKISPREIDEVLLSHPAISEAVCFGVAHKMWGEEVEAAVTLKDTKVSAADLVAYCKDKLSDFKRPKQIHITETIPRTATGKIQRRVVAEAFAPKS